MKTVCVTGGACGLGLALTEEFLKKGFQVFVGYRKDPKGLIALKSIYGDQLMLQKMDVSSLEDVCSFRNFLEEHISGLDVLVNNAAILGDEFQRIWDDLDYESIRKAFEVNTLGPLRTINQFRDLLCSSEMKLVINISSTDASIADHVDGDRFGYCISKAGLNMMSAVAAAGLKEKGIHLLAVHPGYLKTYLHGYRNEIATSEPEEGAEKIVQLLDRYTDFPYMPLNYIDNEGNVLNY